MQESKKWRLVMNDEMQERKENNLYGQSRVLMSVKGRLGSVGQGRGRPRE
jgi:hypothetical protein